MSDKNSKYVEMECRMTRGKDRSYTFLVNSGQYIRTILSFFLSILVSLKLEHYTIQHIRNKKIGHRCSPKMHIDRKVIILNYCPSKPRFILF